eukprot:5422381-Pyramimonas_sp.AAC.1
MLSTLEPESEYSAFNLNLVFLSLHPYSGVGKPLIVHVGGGGAARIAVVGASGATSGTAVPPGAALSTRATPALSPAITGRLGRAVQVE